jgi:hypothetical protein
VKPSFRNRAYPARPVSRRDLVILEGFFRIGVAQTVGRPSALSVLPLEDSWSDAD